VSCIAGMVALVVVVGFVVLPAGTDPDLTSLPAKLRAGVWAAFHEGTKDPTLVKQRVFFFEDVEVALGLAALSGVGPKSTLGCYVVAGLMLCLTAGHAVYVCCVRPHKVAVELGFAVVNAGMQLAAACASMGVLVVGQRSMLVWLGYVMLALDVFFFVEVAILAAVAVWDKCRAQPKSRQAVVAAPSGAPNAPANGDDDAAPLLTVPAAAGVSAHVTNPLLDER